MAVIRVIYPTMSDVKIMKIFEVGPGEGLGVPVVCSKIMSEDWNASVEGMGGVEQDYIDALGITDIVDLR
jgi:hypothetical protein